MGTPELELTADEHRAVPYVLAVWAVAGEDGWVCRAEYEELPGVVAEDPSVLIALDRVETMREQFIETALEHGFPLPVPRSPLRA